MTDQSTASFSAPAPSVSLRYLPTLTEIVDHTIEINNPINSVPIVGSLSPEPFSHDELLEIPDLSVSKSETLEVIDGFLQDAVNRETPLPDSISAPNLMAENVLDAKKEMVSEAEIFFESEPSSGESISNPMLEFPQLPKSGEPLVKSTALIENPIVLHFQDWKDLQDQIMQHITQTLQTQLQAKFEQTIQQQLQTVLQQVLQEFLPSLPNEIASMIQTSLEHQLKNQSEKE